MKIEKKIVSYESLDAEFLGLTLLSKEEYIELESNIPIVDFWWWLRSPGSSSSSAFLIGYYGSRLDCSVNSGSIAVRPAIIIQESSHLKVGDNFWFYAHNWTVISDNYALCDEEFCYMPFNRDFSADDVNNYNNSDIKRYLDREFEKMKG